MLLGMLPLGLRLTIFGLFEAGMLNWAYLGLIPRLEDPLKLAALPFLVEVCYVFGAGVWEAELSGGTGSSRLYRVSHGDEVDVHCAQYFVNSSLFSCFTLSQAS